MSKISQLHAKEITIPEYEKQEINSINLNLNSMPTKSINEVIREEYGSDIKQDIQSINSNQKSNELVDKMSEVQDDEIQVSDLSSEELDEIFNSEKYEFPDRIGDEDEDDDYTDFENDDF